MAVITRVTPDSFLELPTLLSLVPLNTLPPSILTSLISFPSAPTSSVAQVLQHSKHEGLSQPLGSRPGGGVTNDGRRLHPQRRSSYHQLEQRKGDPRQLHDQVQEACHDQPRR